MNDIGRRDWTKEEIILAINLYVRTPFGKIHKGNPDIITLSEKLGRTPSSIALKMANLASLDSTLNQKGMGNHSKLDKIVWDEFFNKTEQILEQIDGPANNQEFSEASQEPIDYNFRVGSNYEITTYARRNQNFFREMILASYNFKCAITGIDQQELLVASHIIPWSTNAETRIDPKNGICLNALHDKAFDKGLLTIDSSHKVLLSRGLKGITRDFFSTYDGKKITLPDKFLPSQDYLEYHRNQIFIK